MTAALNELKPVLVFDSGIGGLTVLREARVLMPERGFIYIADDAGFPYGGWEEQALKERIIGLFAKLLDEHAHASQIIDADAKAPGLTEALMTKDGAVMAVSYGNSDDADDQGHTGSQLRIAAYGPRAANVTGLTDQTDLFYTIRDALGLKTETASAK